MHKDLVGKRILVTGASRGIGKAIAVALANCKAQVVFNYRSSPDAAEELKKKLLSEGASSVHALPFDVNDTDAMRNELKAFQKKEGLIEGLVNNAGISIDQLVMMLKEDELSKILDTNLKSAIMLSSILSRSFMKNRAGSIVNMASVVGLMGNVGQSAYSASKGGLIAFTKTLAKELAPRNVRVNAVCPGFIETDMTKDLVAGSKEEFEKHIPLQRLGSTADVTNLVLFLLSESSGYMTGNAIKVDGGLYI